MKKNYLLRTLLLCMLVLTGGGKLWADETIYSWESPSGTVSQSGGTASAADGILNQSQSTIAGSFYTMKLAKKIADFPTGAVTITLNTTLKENDVIKVTGFQCKNATNKTVSLYIGYYSGTTKKAEVIDEENWVNLYNNNTYANATAPETKSFTVSSSAEGSSIIYLTRNLADTNLFITKVEVIRPGSSAPKQESSVSFGSTTSATVDMVNQATYQLPAPTTTPANATISYTSDKANVATVNSTTGLVTLVGEGTAKITASFAGDASYNGSSAEFTLTVNDTRPLPNKAWTFETWTTGEIAADVTVDGLTVKALSNKKSSIANDNKNVAGIAYTKRLSLGGKGATDNRSVVFNVQRSCRIDIVTSAAADRIVYIYGGSWGGTFLASFPTNMNNPVRQTYYYHGGNQNIVIGSKESGINIYGIYVTYDNSVADGFYEDEPLLYSVSYPLTQNETHYGGDTLIINNIIATAFSEAGATSFVADTQASNEYVIDGYTHMTKGNGTNGDAAQGTFFTFTPRFSGKIEVGVSVGKDKEFHITENGTDIEGYPKTYTAQTTGKHTFDVKAGKTYKVYASGSKIYYYGFKYTVNTAANIAEFKALPEGTEALLTLTDAKITALASAGKVIIEDASGAMLLDCTGSTLSNLTVGQTCNGRLTVKRTADGGEVVSVVNNNFATAAGTATPTNMDNAVATLGSNANLMRYVTLTNLTISRKYNGETFTSVGGFDCIIVNKSGQRFQASGIGADFKGWLDTQSNPITGFDPAVDANDYVKIASLSGILINGDKEGLYLIVPTKESDVVWGADQTINQVSIAEFKQLAQDEEAVIAETAWITFVDGDDAYLQNGTNAIKLKNIGLPSDIAGMKINNLQIGASLDKESADAPVAIPFETGGNESASTFATPRYESADDLKADALIHAMVRLGRSKFADGVLTAPAGTTNTIKVVDKFQKGIDIPEDLAYIVGIIGKNGNDYEFYPVHEDSLKQYSNIVTEYTVGGEQDLNENNQVNATTPAGAERYVTGVVMTATEDMTITADAVTVSEGTDKEMVFTHKTLSDSFTFDATRKGTLTVYLEQQPKQKLSVTEDGKAMKALTSVEQKLDSLEIPVVGGKQYVLTGTVTPLGLRGFTFRDANAEALDIARNIALFKNLYRDNIAIEDTLILKDAMVTYISGDNVFVEDESGAIDFYRTEIQFYVGQKLNGYIVGKSTEEKFLPILKRTSKTGYGNFKVTKDKPQSKVITIAEALQKENLNRFVRLENVKSTRNERGFRVLSDGENEIRIADRFGVFYELSERLKSIEGIVGINSEGIHHFWPTSKAGIIEAPTPATFATGKYYLGNYGAALAGEDPYWGAANDWGTQASLMKHPEYVTLHKMAPEGQYQMEAQVSNGNNKIYFNGDYMDQDQPVTLTITRTKEPIGYSDDAETKPVYGYYIANGENYFGWDGSTTVMGKNVDHASDNAIWIIATEEEVMASLAEATEDEPADATFLLLDPGFGRNNRNKSAWKGDDFSVGGNRNDCNAEKWGGNSQTFDISQTAEVPNGKYKITWNGFYRYNNTTDNTNDVAIAAHADGTEVINSFVYINGKDYPLTSIADEEAAAELSALPFSQAEAGNAFAQGLYTHEAEVIVTDGKLTIGIKKTEHPGTDWTVWDNFELTYYGAADIPSNVNYSWESPNGTVAEAGGTATYEHGKAGEDRTNYKNADYYTLCLNGKKGNLNDADASANAGYILITLDDELQGGETISITAYINKNESKNASAWLVFETGATIESAVYSDAANIDPAFNGVPTETTITVPAEAAGSKTIKLTRSQAGTNLFITKLTIKGESSTEPSTDPTTGITELANRQYEQGAVYNLRGQKVSDSVEGLKKGLYIVNGHKVVIK